MCSASCIIHLHRSGLASAAPDPRPCPLYLLQWLVERYIRALTVTTSWRPSFCFLGSPSRAAHRCPYHERERDSPSLVFAFRLIAAPRRSHSLLGFSLRDTTRRPHTFIPFPVTSLFYSLFLRSILRVRKSFVRGRERKKRRRRGTYPSGRTMSHNSRQFCARLNHLLGLSLCRDNFCDVIAGANILHSL